MVELRTRKRKVRGDGGNHHEKLGLTRISCPSQFTFPDTAGTSPNPVHNITDMRSSKLNQASCTPDVSYLLLSSILFSSSSHITCFLIHNSTIIAEHKVKSTLCISPCHDHELTPSCSIHRVQHTPSAAYTKPIIPLRLSVVPSFSRLRVDPWKQLQLPACLPTQFDGH